MQKNKGARPRGSDSPEETLRGKNKALQKYVKQLQHRIKQLENQLGLAADTPEVKEELQSQKPQKKMMCENCGKGEIEIVEIYRPGSPLFVGRCLICKHQMKMK
jgi:fatty acid-binding protein DegV